MSIINLPGFIDIYVNIRQLVDAKYSENFDSVTAAALAGGVTMICVMANTNPQIVDDKNFKLFQEVASNEARCDYALYFGASETNCNITCAYISDAAALEMNLSHAYNKMILSTAIVWIKHLLNWPNRALGPIVCHAKGHTLAAIILLAHLAGRRIHISHISKKEDILLIRDAKNHGIKITCDACPHNLFLCTDDTDCEDYKYDLCSADDQKALWDNLDYIDIFATEHTANTKEEKRCYNLHGFTGLETILPLLLNAISEGRLTKEDLIKRFHTNPKKIFNLPDQLNTYITVDLNETWVIPEEMIHSKVKWTPFAGKIVKGKICRVFLRGKLVYRNGKVLGLPGFGENVRSDSYCRFICRCLDPDNELKKNN